MSEYYAPEPADTYPTETCSTETYPTETEHPAETGHGSSYEYVDYDGDGYAETTEIDSNGDGEVDTVLVDVDGDYYDDVAAFDNSPGDGHFVPDVVAVAADGDGLADVIFDDVNFDGVFDEVVPGHDEPLAYSNPYEVSAGQAPLDARS